MPTSTWIAYHDLGDGVILVISESDRSCEQYGKFERLVRKLVGHEDFTVSYRTKMEKLYPDAMRDFDAARPTS